MAFVGKRNDNFGLVDALKSTVANALKIRDSLGAKKANVYFYTKQGENEEVWRQILPTPQIVDYGLDLRLLAGGEVQQGDIMLRGIPQTNYERTDIETASTDETEKRFFVIEGRAYTAVYIRKQLLTWEVLIRRFESINEGQLVPPVQNMPQNGP